MRVLLNHFTKSDTGEKAKEVVAQRVDGPTHKHNEAILPASPAKMSNKMKPPIQHGCNQCHQGTHVHGSLPMTSNSHGLHQEEHCGSHHGDGDDPEGDGNRIIWVQEAVALED